jgi:site-specific recombinase XerD
MTIDAPVRIVRMMGCVNTGEAFAAAAVTPTDLRDYRAYLRTVKRRAPATVNRRLAAPRCFFTWAKATGRTRELSTEDVKGIPSTLRAPKSLAKRDLDLPPRPPSIAKWLA